MAFGEASDGGVPGLFLDVLPDFGALTLGPPLRVLSQDKHENERAHHERCPDSEVGCFEGRGSPGQNAKQAHGIAHVAGGAHVIRELGLGDKAGTREQVTDQKAEHGERAKDRNHPQQRGHERILRREAR